MGHLSAAGLCGLRTLSMDRRSGYSTEATCQSQFDLLPPGPGSPTMPSKVRPRAQGDTHKFESHIRGAKSFDCNSVRSVLACLDARAWLL